MKKKILIVVVIILIILGIVGLILMLGKNKDKEDIKEKEIESFEYEYGGGTAYKNYKIYVIDGKTYISSNGVNQMMEKEIDNSVLNDISKIVRENEIDKWDGFNERDENIMDGNSFSLKIKYADGEEINAYGYMKYPENYRTGHNKLSSYLEKIK